MGSIGCVRCEKFRRDFVARTLALVRPNSPECNQIAFNAPKCQFRVQWGGSGVFVAKNSDVTSRHEIFIRLARFALSFVTQPNGAKCTKKIYKTL